MHVYASPVFPKFTFNVKEALKSVHLQKQPPEVFYEKAILKNFAIFTGKNPCWILFINTCFKKHRLASAAPAFNNPKVKETVSFSLRLF